MNTGTIRQRKDAAPPPPLQHLLDTYTTSHPLRSPSPLPASSRIDPKATQRLPPAASNPFFWTIPTWIAFIRFAIAKGIHVIMSLVWHFLTGPPRKSWGYRMTFITSFMRNVGDYTNLADIVLVRRLISLSFLVPLPADAVVTPITFTVPKHTNGLVARGFLRDLDLVESGNRELSGEWVVGTDVWKRLKAERRSKRISSSAGASPSTLTKQTFSSKSKNPSSNSTPTPRKTAGLGLDLFDTDTDSEVNDRTVYNMERVIYYVHGGAYYVGNAATHRLITIGVSKVCNARVFAITYRLAPENVFPLPLHDVFHGYLRLLAPPLSIPAENIIIAGDSAGGGMSLALCMYLRDEGYKMPAGLILMSPWVDLTMSCGSWDENSAWDVVPRTQAADHLDPVACYLGPKGIASYLTHPYASPLFGDLSNLPPMLIQAGDSEVLRDEITLLAHKATLAGVDVTHELYEDMVHVFQMFTWLPASKVAINSVGRWVRNTLPAIEEHRHQICSQLDSDMVDGEMSSPGARTVREHGSQLNRTVGRSNLGRNQYSLSEQRRRSTAFGSGQAELEQHLSDMPTVDFDSLPQTGSRSGSPTPTGSPVTARSPTESNGSSLHSHAPRLRRALTAAAASPSPIPSPAHSPPQAPMKLRARRRTQGSASLHVSPAASSAASNPSNPVSPAPSIRMRLRSPSITTTPQPTARMRSQSHTDIFHLVEGYVEGGAANETVVYGAGGEIRSVGVLGDEGE